MPRPEASRRENWCLTGLFVVALLYSLYGVTYHWTKGFLSGHEFRQTQTALITYYIDRQDNFSLLYETPILGKPWVSLLLEVPFYEWSVVLLSRATGLPHFMAARTITAACFYLTLPALYLLLGRLGLPRARRLVPLALVVSAPVYIYYSRAFLMDSMALMASAWFLVGFVRTMDGRSWRWLAVTTVAGTLAALVKSATFAVWLLPAAGYGAWLLWRDLRAGAGWRPPVKTLLWGLATVVVALGTLRAWIAYTDPIKAAHASAWIFTSTTLTQGNWGLFDLKPLFSAEVWRQLLHCWEQAIMSRWLIALGLLAGLALPAVRGRVLLAGGCFFAAQFLFPNAYAYQDYYFYSCAAFVHGALGFALVGLLDTRLPRAVVALTFVLPGAAQVRAYWQDYRTGQAADMAGGMPLTDVLREHTPPDSVIVVAGADWAAITPYYAQRKALMIRNGLEFDHAYLERALRELAGEQVSALVVYGELRTNRVFLNFAAARLDIDPRVPAFTYDHQIDVYVPRLQERALKLALRAHAPYPGIAVSPLVADGTADKNLQAVSPEAAGRDFPVISPGPYQVNFQYGFGWMQQGEHRVLNVHPNTDLWLVPPAGATTIRWGFGIMPGAYEREEPRTDGVEFSIYGELPDGRSRRVYHRRLDPLGQPADRGDQEAVVPYQPLPGEVLRFSTRPFENSGFDWAYTIRIQVE